MLGNYYGNGEKMLGVEKKPLKKNEDIGEREPTLDGEKLDGPGIDCDGWRENGK